MRAYVAISGQLLQRQVCEDLFDPLYRQDCLIGNPNVYRPLIGSYSLVSCNLEEADGAAGMHDRRSLE